MYRPELKGPGLSGRVDFGNPSLVPVVRMLSINLRRETSAWSPPVGLWLTHERIGETECFVLAPDPDALLPGVLYCHGGGFFLPLQCTSLRIASALAKALPARIFLPDYRLLPEHLAPAAFQDCLAVWRSMSEDAALRHLDGRMLLYGESAGGALAAGLALYARNYGLPQAAGQVLIYPALDDRAQPYPSRGGIADAAWNTSSNAAMWRKYLHISEPTPYLVPLRAKVFSNLPPAYIEPQELDILRDEAIVFAENLRRAGVPVQCNEISGSYHSFDADTDNPFVRSVLAQRVAAMKSMLEDTTK
ncbi:alpha/beta hydrolase fold domain-containing protein [uncultured Ruthenibacterium sp.]|uniref:alpha/beta hydrolase fold domain-containing protein n=1 Tax=uncultured Ruthenibacterium sp. TaxID=1905347 RepID=UPI00349ECC73